MLVNGANGKPLPAVAKGSTEETDPTWSADGTQIAFLSNRRLFLKDLTKPDETAGAADRRRREVRRPRVGADGRRRT